MNVLKKKMKPNRSIEHQSDNPLSHVKSALGRLAIGRSSKASDRVLTEPRPTEEEIIKLGYIPGTIENSIMPPGGRGLADYERIMMFNREELRGKRVLDLGCGPEVKFARELTEASVDAKIVSLSADFYDQKYLDVARSVYDGQLVAGLAQELPFEDNSFDRIFALYVEDHFISLDIYESAIREMARVLARGGVAKMGPLLKAQMASDFKDEKFHAWYDNIFHNPEFEKMGVQVNDVGLPESIIRAQRIYDDYGATAKGLSSLIVITKLPSPN